MIDHGAILRAARTHALALTVCTTGTTTLEATATGYARATGSFLTDGFRVGMEVTPTGFPQTAVGVIEAVSATALTIVGGRTVATSAGSRSISVRLPSLAAWTNVPRARVTGQPWVEEEYLPGGAPFKQTLGPFGRLVLQPTYVLRLGIAQGTDHTAALAYADALCTHFAPTTPLTVAGATAYVRPDLGPFPSPVALTEDGFAVVTLSVPLHVETDNSR
jgi:hypothetical protein